MPLRNPKPQSVLWLVEDNRADDGTIHIVPEHDLIEHDMHDCPCNPAPDFEEAQVIVHKALDGRKARALN